MATTSNLTRSAVPYFIDAEADLGMIAEDFSESVAEDNTAIFNAAMDAGWLHGSHTFPNGVSQPVLTPLVFSGKEFYFKGTPRTTTRYGAQIIGAGGYVPSLPGAHYDDPSGTLGGSITRWTRIDGENGGACLRLCGLNHQVSGIEFRGVRYWYDLAGEGPLGALTQPAGTTRTPVGIEVEGRSSPPSGYHQIRGCGFSDCEIGICARAGYYDTDDVTFISNEDHADQCSVNNVTFNGCSTCFKNECLQAVEWTFNDVFVNGRGGAGLMEVVIFDMRRGGGLTVNHVSINDFMTTLIQVGNSLYNQWSRSITCSDVKWDRGINYAETGYVKIFRFDGMPLWAISDCRHRIRVSGEISYDPYDAPFIVDVSKLVDIPDGADYSLDDFIFDIAGLELMPNYATLFDVLIAGTSMLRPTSDWIAP